MSGLTARRCKVRKGLETPLLVFGMRVSAFYRFVFLVGGYAFLVIGTGVSVITGQGSAALFVAIILLGGITLIGGMVFFKRSARKKRYPPRKRTCSISNHDLLQYLR